VTSDALSPAVQIRPESQRLVRLGGSQRGSQQAMVWWSGSLAIDGPPFRRSGPGLQRGE